MPASTTQRRSWLWIFGLGGLALAGVVMLGLVIGGLSSLLGSGKHTLTTEINQPTSLPSEQQTKTAAAGKPSTLVASQEAAKTPPEGVTDPKGVLMALIPTGQFQMGSTNGRDDEKPVHTVYLDAFYMDIYEVTNDHYAACVSAGICQPPTGSGSGTRSSYYGDSQYVDYPVIWITWEMAEAYCEWRGGRLPSEAQWEKAARGRLVGMHYPWGNEQPVCETAAKNGANFSRCGANNDTKAVGSYSPNGYGLYDMAGNVWEWVWDWYLDSYYSSQASFENPFSPASGNDRVVRGGGWYDSSPYLDVTSRYGGDPTTDRFYNLGFRCSRSP